MRQYVVEGGHIVRVGGTEPALDWTHDNVIRVNTANIHADVASPILVDYDYPSNDPDKQPTKWQYLMSSFLSANPRCFLFGAAGSSKTAACIWAADYLMRIGKIKSVLVIGRLSLLRNAWGNDLSWTIGKKPVVIGGAVDMIHKLAATPSNWYLTNYEALGKFAVPKVDLVIADETTRIKNMTSGLHNSFVKAIEGIPWRWFLTGTPIPTTVMDMPGQALALGVAKIPSNSFVVRDLLQYQVSPFRWALRHGAMDTIRRWCSPALYIGKEEVMEGVMKPPRADYYRAELTQSQLNAIADQAATLTLAYKDAEAANDESAMNRLKPTRANIWNKYGQLAACGLVMKDGEVIKELDTAPRDELLLRVVNQAHKSFIFAPFVATCYRLQRFMEANGKTFLIINGSVSAANRNKIFERLKNDDTVSGIIAVPSAIAHGVNGTAANYVIWYAPPREAESYMQAGERIYRYGQTREMVAVHLAGSGEEERIYRKWNDNISKQREMLTSFKK